MKYKHRHFYSGEMHAPKGRVVLRSKHLIYSAFLSIFSSVASAVPPPESLGLIVAKGSQVMDPKLEKWFASYEAKPDITRRTEKDFYAAIKGLDVLTQDFLRLRHHSQTNQRLEQIVADVLGRFSKYDAAQKAHPLYPLLADELLENGKLNAKTIAMIEEELRRYGGSSCAHKSLLLNEVDGPEGAMKDIDSARSILKRVSSFRNDSFKKKILDEFLEALPEGHRKPLLSQIRPLIASYDKIKEDHSWVLSEAEKNARLKSNVERHLDDATQSAKRRRCSTAKRSLLRAVTADVKNKYFDEAKEVGRDVGSCFRRKGSSVRLRFWRGIEPVYAKTYGFAGHAFALGRIGNLQWGRNRFKEAKDIYHGIYKEARENKDKKIEADALLSLARIYENEGVYPKALDFFATYVEKFPFAEKRDDALQSLVLIAFNLKKVNLAKKYAEILIQDQNNRSYDLRDASSLSFALFWGGRIYYELGDRDRAVEQWQRGASEFFSTFYGALSHYVLERSARQAYRLQPVRTTSFNYEKLIEDLDQVDRLTVRRVEALTKFGLKEDASCELSELNSPKGSHDRQLIESMFLYANLEWLESIKRYNKLPRSYRSALPMGFERLLFPRTYSPIVSKYAERVKVDADLIYAIIRQESVFNPKAISSVGARGLMQLMPSTARMEAKRLSRGYLSRSQRRSMIRRAKYRKNLHDVETNVTLGVHHVKSLMQRYKSPVFVLTSYNASPSATKRWRENIFVRDMLDFIEKIPYKETNAYVKLVLRNYFYYKRWYNNAEASLPHLDSILPESLRKIGPPLAGKKGKKTKS